MAGSTFGHPASDAYVAQVLADERTRVVAMYESPRWRLWRAMETARGIGEEMAAQRMETRYRETYGDEVPWSAGATTEAAETTKQTGDDDENQG